MTADPRLLADEDWLDCVRRVQQELVTHPFRLHVPERTCIEEIKADRAARIEREALLVGLLRRCMSDDDWPAVLESIHAEIGDAQ